MLRFKDWLESLNLQQTVLPDERSKRIWVAQPNNPQQIDYWKRNNTKNIYQFPLNQDKFIHFTLRDSLPEILQRQELTGTPGYSTFAVSLSYGKWIPVVQYNHIVTKKGMTTPLDAKTSKRVIKRPAANMGQEIVAILFQTDKLPKHGNVEEVVWDGSVPLKNVQAMSSRDAIRMLQHTPYKIGEDDQVQYI